MAATVGRLIVDLIARTGDFERSLRRAERRVDRTSRRFRSLGDRMTRGLTIPLGLMAFAAGKAAIDFETAFTGVAKTVEGTAFQLDQLRRGIRAMAKEIPASTEKLSNIAEAAGQLGIETGNVLAFTRVMADLGVATNLSATDAASSLARLANITQMPQDSFDRLGAALVDLGNHFATTEAEIVDLALSTAGAATVIGASEADILGFATAISSVGIEAAAGGSAISRTFINMAQAVKGGGTVLSAFARTAGLTVRDFKQLFERDATEATVKFVEGLKKITDEGGNVFKTFEDVQLSEIRVRKALLNLSGAGSQLRDAIALSNKAWKENIALTREAERRYATAASKLTVLWNKLKDVAITFGDALVPVMLEFLAASEPILKGLNSMALAFTALAPSTKRWILLLAGFLAIVGPVLIGISLLIGALSAFISPMGILITLLSILGAALVSNWGRFAKSLKNIWTGLGKTWTEQAKKIAIAFAPIFGAIQLVGAAIWFFKGLWKIVGDDLTIIWNAMSKTFIDNMNKMLAVLPGMSLLIAGLRLLSLSGGDAFKKLKLEAHNLTLILKGELTAAFDAMAAAVLPFTTNAEASSAAIAKSMQEASDRVKKALAGMGQKFESSGGQITIWTSLFEASSKQIKSAFISMAITSANSIGDFTAQLAMGKIAFKDFAKLVLIELAKIAVRMAALALFGPLGAAFAGGFSSTIAGGRAVGGSVEGGRAYNVGEHGIETFIPEVDGRILSNSTLKAAQGGGGDTITIGPFVGLDFSSKETARRFGTMIRDLIRDRDPIGEDIAIASQNRASQTPRRVIG